MYKFLFFFFSEKPSVQVSVNFLSVKFGDQAKLVCDVASDLPIILVYWEKKSNSGITRISSTTIGTNGTSLDNPSLTILYSTSTDSGYYTCFAGNVVGKNHSLAINFTVFGGKFVCRQSFDFLLFMPIFFFFLFV